MVQLGRFRPGRAGHPTRDTGQGKFTGVTLVVIQKAPTSSAVNLPHAPACVGMARRKLRGELLGWEVAEPAVDDAVLIMSELLTNSFRHAKPLGWGNEGTGTARGRIRAAWRISADGLLSLEVTDGGGITRPAPSLPSVSARGGRGLRIVSTLSREWGVREANGEVTVWAILPARARHARRNGFAVGAVPARNVVSSAGTVSALGDSASWP